MIIPIKTEAELTAYLKTMFKSLEKNNLMFSDAYKIPLEYTVMSEIICSLPCDDMDSKESMKLLLLKIEEYNLQNHSTICPTKYSTETIKPMIVKWCKDNMWIVRGQFSPMLPEKDAQVCLLEKNWKRMSKEKDGETITRGFDCKPFDDQLRAYVVTDKNDSRILSIIVQGE